MVTIPITINYGYILPIFYRYFISIVNCNITLFIHIYPLNIHIYLWINDNKLWIYFNYGYIYYQKIPVFSIFSTFSPYILHYSTICSRYFPMKFPHFAAKNNRPRRRDQRGLHPLRGAVAVHAHAQLAVDVGAPGPHLAPWGHGGISWRYHGDIMEGNVPP